MLKAILFAPDADKHLPRITLPEITFQHCDSEF
jgi:hypothetical protein